MYRCSIGKNANDYKWIGAKDLDEARRKAQELFPDVAAETLHLEQDQDVLDTWFSSGLLPLSVFQKNHPEQFPTSLLETGYDIMFFWVARMVMLVGRQTGFVMAVRTLLDHLEFKIGERSTVP